MKFDQGVGELSMVGPAYARRLVSLGIETVEDLLYHFPHRYEDLSLTTSIAAAEHERVATIHGTVVSFKNVYTRSRLTIQKVVIADPTGTLQATWFNQPFLAKLFKPQTAVAVAGKVERLRETVTLTSPEFEMLKQPASPAGGATIHTGRLVPVYPETKGVSSKWLRSRIFPLLINLEKDISDWLPEEIRRMYDLVSLPRALKDIHFPRTRTALTAARARLAFDELFFLQLASQRHKFLWREKRAAYPLTSTQKTIDDFIHRLPFQLTKAQTAVINDIVHDLKQSRPMNRLLEGDVGSGKTVVAAIAIYLAFRNNLSSAFMAPTQILTHQHQETLENLLSPYGVKTATYTSGTKAKSQKTPSLYLGTQALLYQKLSHVGLVVIDEQHRFGVRERAKLLQAPRPPHLLSLTATPIPRTVALTLYGELDLSIIDELPPGRKPVKTWVVPELKRTNAYHWVAAKIREAEAQVFIVCPLIEASTVESMAQIKAAEGEYQTISTTIFPQFRVGLLHGRMKLKEKNKMIDAFAKGTLDILVSTPVVEVGLDIPRASIMMIEGAERFGLAQLHQLRGRVGRRGQQGYCLLFESTPSSSKRLKAMETIHSGFQLAELDLKLRGPGEMYGFRQHGFVDLKLATFSDAKLVANTQKAAEELIAHDPELAHYPLLKKKLEAMTVPVEPN